MTEEDYCRDRLAEIDRRAKEEAAPYIAFLAEIEASKPPPPSLLHVGMTPSQTLAIIATAAKEVAKITGVTESMLSDRPGAAICPHKQGSREWEIWTDGYAAAQRVAAQREAAP